MKKYFLLLSVLSLIVIFVCSVTLSKSVSESMAVFENFVEGMENSDSGSGTSLGSGSGGGDLMKKVEDIMNSPSTNIPSLPPSVITGIAENVINKKMCVGSGSGCDMYVGSGSSLQQTFNDIRSAVRQASASDANIDIQSGGLSNSAAPTPTPSTVQSSTYT